MILDKVSANARISHIPLVMIFKESNLTSERTTPPLFGTTSPLNITVPGTIECKEDLDATPKASQSLEEAEMLEAIMAPPSMQSSLMDAKRGASSEEALLGASAAQLHQKNPIMHADNSLFIIDWDDTLLATSWLGAQGLRLDAAEIPAVVQEELRALEESMVQILSHALSLGKVAIVTNAESSWVELSARKFVPGVCDLLSQIRILSARSSYQDAFPNQAEQWKMEAYKCVFHEAFPDLASGSGKAHYPRVQVLSLGDSIYERNALMSLAETVGTEKLLPKSVKFVERPNPGQLVRQIEIVLDNLHDVYASSADPVDLMLELEYL
ncbi:Hypothetical Protein FCC1311_078932 [Hondaea fermentalgiana]|uniref:Uncharacterized protein n=1 Tax=Hondaea fermentalgiana TaxID=2315210 RepID=A0A2R5GPF8_9STRA|nr:Hypothetical Protein FCC1311_078932 [Hondaea fermentalgiana]|eukprot:GBG31668.1 Hypothetical Protein FCC1311_078932 [Hondaea fermentalgiana]